MVKKSLTALRNELRNKEFEKFFDFAKANFDDCMQIKSNILTYPVCDDDGNEYFITATISVKVGRRDDNEAVLVAINNSDDEAYICVGDEWNNSYCHFDFECKPSNLRDYYFWDCRQYDLQFHCFYNQADTYEV